MTLFSLCCTSLLYVCIASLATGYVLKSPLLPESDRLLLDVQSFGKTERECSFQCSEKQLEMNGMTQTDFFNLASKKRQEYDQLLSQRVWSSKPTHSTDCICTVRLMNDVPLLYQQLRNTINTWLDQFDQVCNSLESIQSVYPTALETMQKENVPNQNTLSFHTLQPTFLKNHSILSRNLIQFKLNLMLSQFEKNTPPALTQETFNMVTSNSRMKFNEKYLSFLNLFITKMKKDLNEPNSNKKDFLNSFVSDMESYLKTCEKLVRVEKLLLLDLLDVVKN